MILARAALVARLTPPLSGAYRAVAPGDRDPLAHIEYVPGVPDAVGLGRDELEDQVRESLHARRDEEFARGITLVGPHRDELAVTLHGMPVRGYASHGESWSMALALRLASYDIVRAESGPGGEPVLILDDVFAELDADRRERLAGAVADVEQVLITAAVPEDVPRVLTGRTVAVADVGSAA